MKPGSLPAFSALVGINTQNTDPGPDMPGSTTRFNGSLRNRGANTRVFRSTEAGSLGAVVLAERGLLAGGANAVGVGHEGGLL